MTLLKKELGRIYRHRRIRKQITGTSVRPRVCVHRSLKNFYVQVIDDTSGKVLLGMSTLAKPVRSQLKSSGGNANAAAYLGEIFAAEAKKKGIFKISFDRGGYLYHGCVKAFAEAARKGGLEF
ncbi:MAG: 50S ribosomal protein L18 [Candidatus Omnitrophica bacterium]|nr:50S ribosomal protein L18 [Candidatus Omnitrophota bacterium]